MSNQSRIAAKAAGRAVGRERRRLRRWRIERIEASKHKKGRVLVFLADGACLKITEQELLDSASVPGTTWTRGRWSG